MSGHRVELHVSFTVGADPEGRKAAEAVVRELESLGKHGQLDDYTGDFTVTKDAVDGNSWHDRWPEEPPRSEALIRVLESGLQQLQRSHSWPQQIRMNPAEAARCGVGEAAEILGLPLVKDGNEMLGTLMIVTIDGARISMAVPAEREFCDDY